ncbi:hypothetical protein HMPREF0183_0966 [Brevibacterium mcbrellneri ATCC 49030]|uniref:Uncharacterized protein n=1 Tax=Brevibacterium mcbrellneri ATCC 49030 TaxID=585530 RepID=D4YM06_9MICO|nr:hypothetical protein HMPREF0183_0966 [Brevibacterium mcbrellneri ATCC 49030]
MSLSCACRCLKKKNGSKPKPVSPSPSRSCTSSRTYRHQEKINAGARVPGKTPGQTSTDPKTKTPEETTSSENKEPNNIASEWKRRSAEAQKQTKPKSKHFSTRGVVRHLALDRVMTSGSPETKGQVCHRVLEVRRVVKKL